MYSHLLVPVDGSVLSSSNVQSAVRLAAALQARITFFHAIADLGATGDGALLMAMAPQAFATAALGDANAVLLKATVSANGLGVPCDTASRICDNPAAAIVAAAAEHGCDAIVMASRGARGFAGLLHASQTERVLRLSPVAVVVTRVAANEPLSACERVLAVIADEHRSIVAVIQGLCEIVHQSTWDGVPPDREVLEAMLRYLQAFPQELHHPKEELHLHRWLRLRSPGCGPLLRELEAQHQAEREQVQAAVDCLRRMDETRLADVADLGHRLRGLAEAVMAHIGQEQRFVLPLARECLHDSDWASMADDFERSNDPGFGGLTAGDFQRLFTQIANLLPSAEKAPSLLPGLAAA